MKVISVISQKGGAGKTTLTRHLAVEFSKDYEKVAITDTDPQGTLANFYNRRVKFVPDNKLGYVTMDIKNVNATFDALEKRGVDLLIIDTPPTLIDFYNEILPHTDLVLVPTKDSLEDLETLGNTIRAIKPFEKPMSFVLVGGKKNSNLHKEAAEFLESNKLELLGTFPQSEAVKQSAGKGLNVVEFKRYTTPSFELRKVYDRVKHKLESN